MLDKRQDFRDGARRTGLVIRHHGGFHGLNPAALYRTIKVVIVPCLGSPRFVFLNPLSLATDDCRSVLAVKGSLRRFAPWTAAGRSGRRGCLRGKGDVPASAGPDQRVRTSNPRLEFDCRHGFDVRVTPRDN